MAIVQTYYYEEGNTVRVVEPQETYEVRRHLEEERQRRRRQAKRNKARAARKTKVYTMYMTTTVAALCLFFVGYVYLQSSISTTMNSIAGLETEISDLKAQNTAESNRINSSANLQKVKDTAINDLGMVYANADQIVYYDMESTEYMKQYSDIP